MYTILIIQSKNIWKVQCNLKKKEETGGHDVKTGRWKSGLKKGGFRQSGRVGISG